MPRLPGAMNIFRRRRRASFVGARHALLVVWCIVLVACAPNQAATSAQATPSPQALPAPSAPQEITVWHSWNGRNGQVLDMLARAYEQTRPSVRIRLQAHSAATLVRDYSASVADGSAPQILLVLSRYLGDLAGHSYLLPLDEQLTEADTAGLVPVALESARVGGQLYGLPLTYDSLVMFYDRRKMTEAPPTIDQVLATAPAPSDQPVETALPQTWPLAYYLSTASALAYVPAFEGSIVDEHGVVVLDGPRRQGTLRWLEWLQMLRADPRALATGDYGTVDAMIQSNRVTAAVDWTYRLPAYEQIWGRDAVGIAGLPRPTAQTQPPSTPVLSEVLCVNPVTSGQQRAASIDFLRFLSSQEAQELLWSRGGQIPVNQAAHVDGTAPAIIAASAGGSAFPNTPDFNRSWPSLDEMIRRVLAGSATPAEAIDAAAAALRADSQPRNGNE